MQGFIFETLSNTGWRRGGEVFWTLDDAQKAAKSFLKIGRAKAIRILSVQVQLEPVAELPVHTAKAKGGVQ